MDYKEQYNNALKRAKGAHNSAKSDKENGVTDKITEYTIQLTETIFPELKGSEDERIRKALIEFVRHSSEVLAKQNQNNMIAWLEKQGEVKSIDMSIKDKAHQIAWEISKHYDPNACKQEWCEMAALDMASWLEEQGEPQDQGEISDGYHTFNELYYYRMLYNAAFFNMLPKECVHKSKKHNDGEQCFGGGWFIVMANLPTGQISNHYELKYWDLFNIPEKEFADKWDGHTPQEAAERLHRYLLEKQGEQKQTKLPNGEDYGIDSLYHATRILEKTLGEVDGYQSDDGILEHKCAIEAVKRLYEQKSADKLEPRFKKGDWIVNKKGGIALVKDFKKDSYNTQRYYLEWTNGNTTDPMPCFVDNEFHIFDITKDAKDGDVLVTESRPFIFRGFLDKRHLEYPVAYCGINCLHTFYIPPMVENKYWTWNPCLPATKEQRDKLEKAIADAGYKWNAERKELKKLEQKSSWSEEDEKMFDSIIEDVMPLGECPDYPTEEERVRFYEGNRKVDLLKSIKERMQAIEQKPSWSEKDEEMLKDIIQGLKATEQLIFTHDLQGKIQIQGRINWLKSIKKRMKGGEE